MCVARAGLKFGVRHFAGDVLYSADGFVDKNVDRPPEEAPEMLLASSNDVLRSIGSTIDLEIKETAAPCPWAAATPWSPVSCCDLTACGDPAAPCAPIGPGDPGPFAIRCTIPWAVATPRPPVTRDLTDCAARARLLAVAAY